MELALIAGEWYASVPSAKETSASVRPDDMNKFVIDCDGGKVVTVPIIASILDCRSRRRRHVTDLNRRAEHGATIVRGG